MTGFAATEAGIRQLQARCADAVFRKDAEALGDCFAEDAVWWLTAGVQRGRADIVAAMRAGFTNFRSIFMTLRAPLLELSEREVSGRTYVTEEGVRADGTAYLTIGIYFERFALGGDGRWRFTWRHFQAHYAGPPGLTGPFIQAHDFGAPPAMPPRDDPAHPGASEHD
jgi:ketosteroid isomerase-like protein